MSTRLLAVDQEQLRGVPERVAAHRDPVAEVGLGKQLEQAGERVGSRGMELERQLVDELELARRLQLLQHLELAALDVELEEVDVLLELSRERLGHDGHD